MRTLTSAVGILIMLAAGAAFAIGAVITLDLGSLRRMGPGAFPLLVGTLLCMLALIALLQHVRTPVSGSKPDLVAVAGVAGSVAAFAFFTPIAGVLPATALAVFVVGSAIANFRWLPRLALSIGVALAVWLIFVVGLGIPFVAVRGL